MLILQIPIEDVIKELLTTAQQDRSQLRTVLIWAVVIIVINIISVVWNSVLQVRLKNKEKEIANYNLKQEKRILVYESIFKKFNDLTLFLPHNDVNTLIQDIQSIQGFINYNKIYIDKNSISIYNEFLDYFRKLITFPYQKDVRFESEQLDKIVNDFSRI
jgi:hypothetical protein